MEILNNCPVCNNTEFKNFYSISDCRCRVNKIKFNVVKCLNCNLFFINPRPDLTEIIKYYPTNYYNVDIKPESLINKKINILKNKFAVIEKYKDSKSGSIREAFPI